MENSNLQNEKEEDEAIILEDEKVNNKGGWITFPFIIGSVIGLTLAATTWYANIVVYAMRKYNIQNISAAQFQNVVGGGVNFFPILGAILADSLFGSYWVVLFSSFISLLGAIMFTLSSTIPSLTPQPCTNTTLCNPPSTLQYAFLYTTIAVSMVGFGGTRFVLASFGADQFKKLNQQRVFFNWFVFAIEATSILGFTLIVYLQDKGKWALSFGISVGANAIAIALFLFGSRFYWVVVREGSPFVSIARVLVASLRKSRKLGGGEEQSDYFYGGSKAKMICEGPSSSLSFFNRAALIKEANHHSKTLTTSWTLCTINEVEDLKKLIKALPIWSGGILLSTLSAVGSTLAILQALSMDRKLSPKFTIPAASILVFPLICGAIALTLLDRIVYPLWNKLHGRPLTALKRIGIGYFLSILSMIAFALIEKDRLKLAQIGGMVSVIWLVLPLGLLGVAMSFYYPSELGFFYQELPKSLRSTAACLASLHMAVGYYLSTVFIGVVQRSSSWLPNDINHGRLDKVYWILVVIGGINFGYFVVCAKLYKYTSFDECDDRENVQEM